MYFVFYFLLKSIPIFFKLYIFEESQEQKNKKKHCAFKTQPNSPTISHEFSIIILIHSTICG